MLRRSKVFIVTGVQIAVSSVDRHIIANTYTQIYIHIVFAVRRKSFNEEYVKLLKRFNVPHNQRYLFQAVNSD